MKYLTLLICMVMLPAAASAAWTVGITAENQVEPIYFGYSEDGIDNGAGSNDIYTAAPQIGKTVMHLDDLYSKKVKSQELTWNLSIAVPDGNGTEITWDASSVPLSVSSLTLSINDSIIDMQRVSAYRLSKGWHPATISVGDDIPCIYVDDSGGADFTTIQAAVNAASAGDTIVVRDGTYAESVTVDKKLTIRSENGPENTTIREPRGRTVFRLSADNVKISGLTIAYTDDVQSTPIEISGANYCIISDNVLSHSFMGIKLIHTEGNTVTNNTISSNEYGIWIYGAKECSINQNNITNNYCSGISAGESSSNHLFLNNFEGNPNADLQYRAQPLNDVWHSPDPIQYRYNGDVHTQILGNYWDTYTGTDSNNDGIGDTPYSISGINDEYPLMGNWTHGKIFGPKIGTRWLDNIVKYSLGADGSAESLQNMLGSDSNTHTTIGGYGYVEASWDSVDLKKVSKVTVYERTTSWYEVSLNPNDYIYPNEYSWRAQGTDRYAISFKYPNIIHIRVTNDGGGYGNICRVGAEIN